VQDFGTQINVTGTLDGALIYSVDKIFIKSVGTVAVQVLKECVMHHSRMKITSFSYILLIGIEGRAHGLIKTN